MSLSGLAEQGVGSLSGMTRRKVSEFQRSLYSLTGDNLIPLAPRYRGLRAAYAVFCLGFGALSLFAALGLGDPRLPGLYSFRAASVGDGFLLPLLAYALVRSAGPHGPGTRFQAVFSRAGGATGALVGLAVQAQALIDPDARLDWTFPAPHSYNFAGWYHAVFLVSASGFYGRELALVLARLREEARESLPLALRRIRSVGTLGVLIPGFSFLGLLVEDGLAPDPVTILIVLASLLVFGLLAGAALYWACGRDAAWWCALAVLSALLPSFVLCDLYLSGTMAGGPGVLLSKAGWLVHATATARLDTALRLAVVFLAGLLLTRYEVLILRIFLRRPRQYQP